MEMKNFILISIIIIISCSVWYAAKCKVHTLKDYAGIFGLSSTEVEKQYGRPDESEVIFYEGIPAETDKSVEQYLFRNITSKTIRYGNTVIEFNALGKVYRVYGREWVIK